VFVVVAECYIDFMKKYKKLSFTFSLLSLGGVVAGLAIAVEGNWNFDWEAQFAIWVLASVPLIVLWIYTRLFNEEID